MRLRHSGLAATRSTRNLLMAFGVAIWCGVVAAPAMGADATGSITIQAQVSSRTMLQISARSLQFDVATAAEPATASVDFSASARTHAGVDVVLSIELLGPIARADDLVEAGTSLKFVGQGEGTGAGDVGSTGSSVAARWTGSGHRTGRLVFALRTRAPGSYSVPMRFVLTAP